ncbi:uncharacterized protein TRUGW13939_06018 [Talaromyces rugulosus]|uniref:HIT-type domain-containing protein n=1 Tax=Talaromyces rugulosus TaxID=121627 RepID=A0A7H8QXN8_TALRU|nr:uncharacterized protein TRUGW13939_06018 [Talaromyces rugulosus]QKX58890.1 hypothetical protein TRUGW13939_06018 [Talaromyces rugulosus]
MPLVEILTTSKSHTTPGWAYVPDTSFRSSQTTKASAGGRKRGIREPAGRTTNLTSRQNQAIIRHLAELDRENHRENLHIAVPARKDSHQRVDHGRPTKSKMTSNVRRILQSQKTFKNHLDDEEAALAHQASIGVMGRQAGVGASGASTPAPAAAVAGTPVSKVAKASSGRRSVTPITAKPAAAPPVEPPVSSRQKRARTRKSLLTVTPAESTPTTEKGQEEATEEAAPKTKEEEKEENPSTETTAGGGGDDAMEIDTPVIKGLIKTTYDNDPLLKSHLPRPPTDRVMAALLAEPPLTYNSARARPSASGKPARYFCTICGYWGKIKCKNCGVRMCGLDCYKVHEDSRCGAFF